MFLPFKKLLGTFIFNLCLFLLLMIGIQNSSDKSKVNLLFNQTIELPISFIIGLSFISGTTLGSLSSINFSNEN